MALAPHHRKNCDTLLQAAADGNVALVECRKRATGEVVAMLCSIGREDGKFAITPFAEMVSGNPFELYDPPDPGSDTGFVEKRDG